MGRIIDMTRIFRRVRQVAAPGGAKFAVSDCPVANFLLRIVLKEF